MSEPKARATAPREPNGRRRRLDSVFPQPTPGATMEDDGPPPQAAMRAGRRLKRRPGDERESRASGEHFA